MVRLSREGGIERLVEKDERWMNRWMDGGWRERERKREGERDADRKGVNWWEEMGKKGVVIWRKGAIEEEMDRKK